VSIGISILLFNVKIIEKMLNERWPTMVIQQVLFSDPSTPARYFCSHKAGIHCVGLPMVAQLSEMAQRGKKDVLKRSWSAIF